MPRSSSPTPETVPFRIAQPDQIPVQRYYDEGFFNAENERLWPHVWQMACRLEQIPDVGDWTEYSNLGKSVIIVRTSEGVKAYHNACRHRGVQLAEGHGNCKMAGFICPFHGWRWDIDGKNTFVYGRHLFGEDQLRDEEIALKPCRVETWGGCAFINFDDGAPSLRDCMGPLAEKLEAHGASDMRAEWWYATVLPSNWKLAMEAFMEGYHTMKTHPQMQTAASSLFNMLYGGDMTAMNTLPVRTIIKQHYQNMAVVSEGMAGMYHQKVIDIAAKMVDIDLPDDPNEAIMAWYGAVNHEVTQQLRTRGEPIPDLNAVAVSHPVKAVEFIFPHYFLLPVLGSMASYRIRPLTPETCLFELWSLTLYPEGEEPEPVREPTMLDHRSEQFPPIPRQDYSNIPRQQIGLHAGGFEYMRLGKNIEGLIGNYQQVIDGYLMGANPEKLAEATQRVASGFDGPIIDFDFGDGAPPSKLRAV